MVTGCNTRKERKKMVSRKPFYVVLEASRTSRNILVWSGLSTSEDGGINASSPEHEFLCVGLLKRSAIAHQEAGKDMRQA